MDIKQENNSGSPSLIEERVNAKLFFSGAQRRRVLEEIKGCILDGVSIITLTGEEGTGKSIICKMVEKELPADYTGVYLPDTLESFDDVVRLVAVMLGTESSDKPDSLSSLVLEIINNLKATDRRLVLIFDQAERMFLATIERIRKMLDLVNREEERLQIIFSGRKTLLDNLKQLKICDFSKVYERNFVLHPLGLSETYAYLNHCARKKTKPHLKNVFTPELAKRIYNMAQGNLRMTNVLAMKALGLAESRKSIADLLDSVTEETKTPPKSVGKKRKQKSSSLVKRLAFCAVGGGLLGAAFFFFSGEDASQQNLIGEQPTIAKEEVEASEPTVAEVKVEPEPLGVQEEAVEESKIVERDISISEPVVTDAQDKKVPYDVPPQETELHQDALFDPDSRSVAADKGSSDKKQSQKERTLKTATLPDQKNQEKQTAAEDKDIDSNIISESLVDGQALTDPPDQATENAEREIQQIYATKSKTIFVPVEIPEEDRDGIISPVQDEAGDDSDVLSSQDLPLAEDEASQLVQEATTASTPLEVKEKADDASPVSLSPMAVKKVRAIPEDTEIPTLTEGSTPQGPSGIAENDTVTEGAVADISSDDVEEELEDTSAEEIVTVENPTQNQLDDESEDTEQKGVRIIAEMNKKTPEDGVAADSKQLSAIAPVKFNDKSDTVLARGFGDPSEQDGDLFQKRLSAGSSWLENKRPGKHTVQLMALSTAQAEENLRERFQQQEYQDIADKLYILKDGKYKVFVYYGEYPDLDSARQARNTLPLFLRKYDPYAVSIQEAVNKAGSPEKSQ